MIVIVKMAKAVRDGFQTTRLRRQLLIRRVGTAHNPGKAQQGGIAEVIFLDDGVEGALGAMMPKLDAWHVVRDGPCLLRDRQNLVSRHVEELGFRIDEALD